MGDGVPASLTRAFALFFRAAGMGHARGMCYVAAAYHFGQGVSESRFDALRWCAFTYLQLFVCVHVQLLLCCASRTSIAFQTIICVLLCLFSLFQVPEVCSIGRQLGEEENR